jgi:hypothetical protein
MFCILILKLEIKFHKSYGPMLMVMCVNKDMLSTFMLPVKFTNSTAKGGGGSFKDRQTTIVRRFLYHDFHKPKCQTYLPADTQLPR